MIVEIKVPALAESVADATLLDWQKQVGDFVKRGDNLIDLETDKVTLEVAAQNDGIVKELLRKTGDIVVPGDVLAIIDTDAEVPEQKAAIEILDDEIPEQVTQVKPFPCFRSGRSKTDQRTGTGMLKRLKVAVRRDELRNQMFRATLIKKSRTTISQ